MCKSLIRSILMVGLLLPGLCLAQSMVPIDPATVTDGHVYLFDGGAASDATPQGLDLPVVGAPQVVKGLNGDALQFDGAADGLTVPDSQFINTGAGTYPNRTVIAVFKCDDVDKPGKQTVFEEGGTTRGSNIYVSEGLLYVSAWNRAEYNWNGEWPSTPIESGEWYVAAMVIREGGEAVEPDKFEMWVNGELIAQLPGGQLHDHGDDGGIGYTNVNTVFHDGNASPTTNAHYFGGAIDEIWILNEALPEAQLRALGPNPALAKDPAPAKEGADALRDGTLSWEPGQFAHTHDVYLGTAFTDVNEASRDNPLNVLASQDQTEASYDPGRLEFGQTYFWRVDEVNGAPDRTIFKGEVWSFEVEPFSIPVANIQASASSSHSADMGPEKTVDGSGLDALDQHGNDPVTMWLSGMGDPTPSIQYEFDKAYKLDQMVVWNSNQAVESFVGLGAKDVTIETSTDGEIWVQLEGAPAFAQAPGKAGYAANTTVDFAGTVAQYVKLTITSGYGMIPQYGLSEVRFLAIPVGAREPQPADGAALSDIDVVLSWRAGREAGSHEIYLGTDPNALDLIATTLDNTYEPADLALATTYYWQIIEVNGTEDPAAHAGDIWSFTTPSYAVVDSFDQYDNDCDRIFFAWADGLGHNGGTDIDNCDVPPSNGNGGGSIVGNNVAPFAETTIVRSGSTQSMPFNYDNAFGPSEATLAFPAQDWTAHAIRSLSLFFYGDPANTGQLYVKINNTKVAYSGLPDALQRAQWVPWNIDLSQVGGNLQSVTSLTIGVDGATAAGMLYVDDIRLYPLAPQTVTPQAPAAGDPNLKAYYEFEGNADDSLGNYSGTVSGGVSGPLYVAGKQGQAISLDEIDDQSVFLLPQAEVWPAYAVSMWAKTDLFAQDNNSSLFSVSINTTSGFQVNMDGTDPGNYIYHGSVDGTIGPASSSWTHLGVTCDGVQTKLYYNGVLSTTLNVADNTMTKIAVGVNRAEDNWFGGEIDELKIYDRALSSAEMAGLAELAQPVDLPFSD